MKVTLLPSGVHLAGRGCRESAPFRPAAIFDRPSDCQAFGQEIAHQFGRIRFRPCADCRNRRSCRLPYLPPVPFEDDGQFVLDRFDQALGEHDDAVGLVVGEPLDDGAENDVAQAFEGDFVRLALGD